MGLAPALSVPQGKCWHQTRYKHTRKPLRNRTFFTKLWWKFHCNAQRLRFSKSFFNLFRNICNIIKNFWSKRYLFVNKSTTNDVEILFVWQLLLSFVSFPCTKTESSDGLIESIFCNSLSLPLFQCPNVLFICQICKRDVIHDEESHPLDKPRVWQLFWFVYFLRL